MRTNNSLFIAFEGTDGSGKTTQAALLRNKLASSGHLVYSTFEPTDNELGKIIRSVLKHEKKYDHYTLAALFAADRLDHILHDDYGLLTKLQQGNHVITDRYYFSSYAYHTLHVDMDWVIDSNRMAAQHLKPDITFFIDLDPEECMNRIVQNRSQTELFETLDMLKAIRQNYLSAFEKLNLSENIISIDGNRTIELIADEIYQKTQAFLIQSTVA